jgi:protein TonB
MRGKKVVGKDSKYPSTETGLGRCLVDADPEVAFVNRRRRSKMFGMSLAIEIVFLVLLIAVPILTTVAQPPLHMSPPAVVTFFGPRLNHQLTEHLVRSVTSPSHGIANPFLSPIAPVNDGRSSHIESNDEMLSTDVPADFFPPGAMEGIELPKSTLPAEPPHVAPREPKEKRILKISGPIIAAQLISRIEPKYPYIAIQTRREGIVLLHAIISREGQITSLDVLSGDPLLVGSALDAVKQWRYRPTILNGEPVEVETSITVIFQLRR